MIRWPGHIEARSGLQRDRQRARLVPDAAGRGRRPRRQGQAAQRPQSRRQDLQGPPRRLQPASVPHRPGAEQRAEGVHLLQRRRRSGRSALRELEDRVRGAARARHAGGVGRAVHETALHEDVRPARRPVRAGGHHVEHLLRLAPGSGLHRPTAAQAYVAKFLDTFKEFPPSQRAATFTIDQAMDKLKQNLGD